MARWETTRRGMARRLWAGAAVGCCLVVGVSAPGGASALGASQQRLGVRHYRIDAGTSRMTVEVGKAGIFRFAGHDHEIAVPVMAGEIRLDTDRVAGSSVRMTFDAAALRVTGRGEPPEDVPEVQAIMLSDRVLDVARYPTVRLESTDVSGSLGETGGNLEVRGDLTLRGVTRAILVEVELRLADDALRASGAARLKQTDFGIRPVSAAAGTVKVRDEVEILFDIAATATPRARADRSGRFNPAPARPITLAEVTRP